MGAQCKHRRFWSATSHDGRMVMVWRLLAHPRETRLGGHRAEVTRIDWCLNCGAIRVQSNLTRSPATWRKSARERRA
jgi:hypothetical protein